MFFKLMVRYCLVLCALGGCAAQNPSNPPDQSQNKIGYKSAAGA